eukprot:GHRR01027229.1.p2 GENE.GHRR01027229.1~~GHRR01027229.1.p2  ORF type:complete len:124 (-),score=22.42 GHRR01027229.1:119-490(-)
MACLHPAACCKYEFTPCLAQYRIIRVQCTDLPGISMRRTGVDNTHSNPAKPVLVWLISCRLQVSSALDVIFFVREICETHPPLRPSILERLRDTFSTIRASRVVRCLLSSSHQHGIAALAAVV